MIRRAPADGNPIRESAKGRIPCMGKSPASHISTLKTKSDSVCRALSASKPLLYDAAIKRQTTLSFDLQAMG